MYERLKKLGGDNVLGLRIKEGLSEQENDELAGLVEKMASHHGKVRLLIILEGYPVGDNAEVLYNDLRFVKLSADKIERMAVAGDTAVQETWIALFSLFGGLEAAYFSISDMDKAEKWLNQVN
jgi:hypothetical protein